jgi:5-methylcytosine-specific restriction endonuclease McrA
VPNAPRIVPLKPAAAAAEDRGSTTDRGYGWDHQKQRDRILKRFPICQRCGEAWSRFLHHVDRNPMNRDDSNVEALCKDCHDAEHHGAR